MRLIDADALIEDIKTVNPIMDDKIEWGKRIVNAAPTIDPVRHGRWLFTDTNTCECSVCHTCEPYPFSEFEWCPNCGARMDGGTDNATD